MTEMADRIRQAVSDMTGVDCDGDTLGGAVLVMLDFAEQLEPSQAGRFFAIEIRNRIAAALGIQEGGSLILPTSVEGDTDGE